MPIHEYYCPDNHTIYQFFAKTLAQGQTIPKCPGNPKWRMEKMLSPFAVPSRARKSAKDAPAPDGEGGAPAPDDPRMEAAMDAMEHEFAHADENDPRAMARMMRRMAVLTGEKIDGQMEDVVRRLEEGADPESLEDELDGADDGAANGTGDADDDSAANDAGAANGADGAAAEPAKKDVQSSRAGSPCHATNPCHATEAATKEAAKREGLFRFKIRRSLPARRDPKLYDYDED